MGASVEIEYAKPLHRVFTTDKRIKILVGGRGSTKSTGVADYILANMANGSLWCCARELQNSIEESVHRLMLDEIDRLEIAGFTDTKSSITHTSGGRAFYKGLSRNITSLQSTLTGIDGLWIEEGQALSDDTIRVLTASVRLSAKDARRKIAGEEVKFPEIIITMNRGSSEDPIAKKYLSRAEGDLARKGWYEDDVLLVVECNYPDIPREWFLASGLEQERADDKDKLTPAQYDSKWLGKYLDEIEDAIILQEWFEAAIDAHEKLGFKPRGAKRLAHDPADSGDARSDCLIHGSIVLDCRENEKDDVNDALDWSLDYAITEGVDLFIWDGDGLGLSLKRQVSDSLKGKQIKYEPFHGGGGVDRPLEIYEPIKNDEKPKTNKEYFKNKRAQYAGVLRNKFYKTWRAVVKKEYIDPDELISISSKIKLIDKLKAETCRIPKKSNGSGVFQIMDKKEMKTKYKIDSPNMFDSLMMAQIVPEENDDYDDYEEDHYSAGGWMS